METLTQDTFYEKYYDDYIDCIDAYFSELEAGERFKAEDMLASLDKFEPQFPQNFLLSWIKEEVIKTLTEQKRVRYVFRGSHIKVK